MQISNKNPQLSSYLNFFDLLSTLEKENSITYNEKQLLKTNFAVKDLQLMNILTLSDGNILENDKDDRKLSLLNYLQELSAPQRSQSKDKSGRAQQRSRTMLNSTPQIMNPQNSFGSAVESITNEGDILTQVELLNKSILALIQNEGAQELSTRLKDSLGGLGNFLQNCQQSRRGSFSNLNMNETIANVRQIYKNIKRNFNQYMHSHLLIMDELISYQHLFELLKELALLLVDCDNFSFLVVKKNKLDYFQTVNDTFTNINDKKNDFLDALQGLADNRLHCLKNNDKLYYLLNCSKDQCSYLLKVNQIQELDTQIYFIYHQSLKNEQKITYQFLSLTNQYGFFDEVNELSLFLYQTIKQAKVQVFSPLEIADMIQDIGLAFVRCSKYLFIEEILRELNNNGYIVERTILDDTKDILGRSGNSFSKFENVVSLELKDAHPVILYFHNINLSQKKDRKLLLEVQQTYDKYLRFIKQCYDKTAFYKFFLRSNESLIFEFDKRGQLIFLSRPIPQQIRVSFNIKIDLSMVQSNMMRYNRIFEGNKQLVLQIENHLQVARGRQIKNQNLEVADSQYEIFMKVETSENMQIFIVRREVLQGIRCYLLIELGCLDQELAENLISRKSLQLPRIGDIKKNKKITFTSRNIELCFQTCINQQDKFFNQSESADMSSSVAQLYMPTQKGTFGSSTVFQSIQLHTPRTPGMSNKFVMRHTLQPSGLQKILMKLHFTDQFKFDNHPIQKLSKYSQISLNVEEFDIRRDDQILDTSLFNILEIKNKIEKQRVVWCILKRKHYLEEFEVANEQFSEFLLVLEQKYNQSNNPFHNYDHGIAVMQFTNYLLMIMDPGLIEDNFIKFTLLISALCHDVAHTGRTNLFEMNSLSPLAIRYHDRSVLEQHHAATAIQLLREEKTNFLKNMSDDKFKEFRIMLIHNILHTDMKEHFNMIKLLETRMKEDKKSFDSEEDQKLLTGMLIHASDFNGGVRIFPISRNWSELVNKEFIAQYEEEELNGYPQLSYMKDLNKEHVMAKSEMGFFKFIVRPLYVMVNEFLNQALIECVQNLDETILEWDKIYNDSLLKQLECSLQNSICFDENDNPIEELDEIQEIGEVENNKEKQ